MIPGRRGSTLAAGLILLMGLAAMAPDLDRPPVLHKAVGATKPFADCADLCPQMIAIPAGDFTMGSVDSEAFRATDEGPRRRVTIARPFAVARFDVTVAQYAAFARETARPAGGDCWITDAKNAYGQNTEATWRNPGFPQGAEEPVVCVSWPDAKAYAAWLSRKAGHPYRLLSEAEWEYAARAGRASLYAWGDDPAAACAYANVADATVKALYKAGEPFACADGYAHTSPVGRFKANAFGLFDMAGDVWQWVEDCHGEDYASAPSDGSAYAPPGCAEHTVRGGSWFDIPPDLRVANRLRYKTGARGSSIGFRVARSL